MKINPISRRIIVTAFAILTLLGSTNLSAQTNRASANTNLTKGPPLKVLKGIAITNAADRLAYYASQTNSNLGQHSYIGGGLKNSIAPDAENATIGGGQNNEIQSFARNATIGGGLFNKLSTNTLSTTIGGGYENLVANSINFATIAGGVKNSIKDGGFFGTVGGGSQNSVGGAWATVPGGLQNAATGSSSFAAGTKAKAAHEGALVLSDAYQLDFKSTASNQFSVRATGGVRFVSAIETNGTPKSGIELAAGSGSWATLSDKTNKTDHQPIDPKEVLARVSALPITTWSYTTQDASIRHIGPTAQDFRAAFPLGEDDRHINTVDADGIALAAIQGLNALVREQQATLREQNAQIERLSQRVKEMEQSTRSK